MGAFWVGLFASACLGPSREPALARAPAAALRCPTSADGAPRLVVRRAWRAEGPYRLLRATVALDGQLIFKSSDPAALRAPLAQIYDAPANPGPHQLLTAYTVRRMGGRHGAELGSTFSVPHEHWLVVPTQGTECTTLTLVPSGGEVTERVE